MVSLASSADVIRRCRDKTQSILTQIVAHCAFSQFLHVLQQCTNTVLLSLVDYSSMVKQRSLGPDNLDDGSDASSAFLDALRTRAMDDLHLAALEYGIIMKDLGESRDVTIQS